MAWTTPSASRPAWASSRRSTRLPEVRGPDEHLLGGERPDARRRDQHHHEVGRQPASAARRSSSPATKRFDAKNFFATSNDKPLNRLQPVRRQPRRPHQGEPDVLLRGLRTGPHPEGRDDRRHGADDEDAHRRFHRDPGGHLRSVDDAPHAVSGQHRFRPTGSIRSRRSSSRSTRRRPAPAWPTTSRWTTSRGRPTRRRTSGSITASATTTASSRGTRTT